jgi:aminoglycoside phosphotransferase (APT) family kinase protein
MATIRRGRRIGAAIACFRRPSNSGRDARTAFMTGCSTAWARTADGRLSALLPEAVLILLRKLELLGRNEIPAATALPGGVSSDIWRIDLARGPVCVKRALPRLRVAQRWEAPVERNGYEYEWFRVAGRAVPGAVPKVIGRDSGLFAMEYLEPAAHPVWKQELRDGRARPGFASLVGLRLAAIHAATAGRAEVAGAFPTDEIFNAIRLEPYLGATASKHPDLSEVLLGLAKRTAHNRLCLVHGDVSPKNILAGPDGPIFLDAECAWYGDPAFDLAFCLNHLLLKCLWVPSSSVHFLQCFDALAVAYLDNATWEPRDAVEGRAASLLPGLLLARVDGKSPVEYLTAENDKQTVRAVARRLLSSAAGTLSEVRDAWRKYLP